jgi:acyl carrier protein
MNPIASRTPEGEANHCPVCGASVAIEPSRPPGDASCPSCGVLLWFHPTSAGVSLYETKAVAPLRARVVEAIRKWFGVTREEPAGGLTFDDLGADSLDLVELAIAVEEEFGVTIADKDAESLRTADDLLDLILRKKLER